MGELELPAPDGVPALPPPPPAGTSLRERLAQTRWSKLLEQLTPAIALFLGILSQTYAKHTVAFAPKAVALLVVAWALAAGVGEWLPEPRPDEPHPRWRNFLRKAAATVTVGLFRNVLFFLVPIWFASSTLGSINMIARSCWARSPSTPASQPLPAADARAPAHPDAYCSSVLFVALVPATAVETSASPRLSAALAAGVAWLASSLATSRTPLTTRIGRIELGAGALVAAGICALAAPLLPPVPVACTASAIGTGIINQEIEGAAERFPAGTKRVYAWFQVQVPRRYRQGIRFEWYRDGERAATSPRARSSGARAGLPDFVVYVVTQTGLMASRSADRRVPAHRAGDASSSNSSIAVRTQETSIAPSADPIAAVRRAFGDPTPLAVDAVWQKPFDYDTGHLHRLAVLAPDAAADAGRSGRLRARLQVRADPEGPVPARAAVLPARLAGGSDVAVRALRGVRRRVLSGAAAGRRVRRRPEPAGSGRGQRLHARRDPRADRRAAEPVVQGFEGDRLRLVPRAVDVRAAARRHRAAVVGLVGGRHARGARWRRRNTRRA